ncbi:MAG: cytochrome c oxidase accessory protein CcoG [Rhodospirillaceae bacterium]|nr:cytochrome c oxidase accessory protein CcoG [Rhodospirillaceae bacterium]MDD9928308.1 cytochrome c oxidase accessory protein CcoG [Rhodospirillaceae bacterium]
MPDDKVTRLESLAQQAVDAVTPGAQVAEGVERADVDAVNRKEDRTLYAKRKRIHPKRAYGTFRSLKWFIMAVTLGIYYVTPWLRWDRGEGPNQAVLLDLPNRKFYFFFVEIWPQEIYLLTGVLVISALALFLFTSLFGRVWCGYSCPQTVWTDLFIAIERLVEGDRNARIRLDKASWSGSKIGKKIVKHSVWLVIAVMTGGAWVFYFRDAPTLAIELATFDAPLPAVAFIAILTFTTYALGGLMREQVCIYMCPWPRIQGAMFDEDSLLVTYREQRGEPRGAHKKGESWDNRGDCIRCRQCVAVCPVGIDIRDGPQFECIHCALCIDACNAVMAKIGRPPNLIAYETFRNLEATKAGSHAPIRFLRPRIIVYGLLLALVTGLTLYGLFSRETLSLSVLRDRNPLYVTLSDGSVRNGYTLKLINREREARIFRISSEGLAGAKLSVMGQQDLIVVVPADDIRSVRFFIAAAPPEGGNATMSLIVTDSKDGRSARAETSFRGP